jgi:hypothetical protein
VPSRLSDTPCKISYCRDLRPPTYPPAIFCKCSFCDAYAGRSRKRIGRGRAAPHSSFRSQLPRQPMPVTTRVRIPRNVPRALRRRQALSGVVKATHSNNSALSMPRNSLGQFFGPIAIRGLATVMREPGISRAAGSSRQNSSVFYFTPRVNSEGPQKTHRD